MYRYKQKKGKKKERSRNFSLFSCPSQCSAFLYNITVLSNPAHLLPVFSGLLNKLFPAFGADDGDLAFALGHPHLLPAFGAGIIAVVPVLDPLQNIQKAAVFLVTLVGLPGKCPVQRPAHANIGQQPQNKIAPALQKHGDQHQHHAGPQNHRVQLIRAVAACHKAIKSCF